MPNRRSSPRRCRRAPALSTSCWPQAPGAKSPFARNGRSAFRCGDMIGSPPRPGTSVNRVATISMPRARALPTSGASLSGRAAMAGAVYPGAAIGAVAMQEIVLQIPEDEGCGLRIHGCGSTIRLPSASIRPTSPGSITVVASGCSRIAGPAIAAPAGRSSRAKIAVSRQPPSNQTGRVPSRAALDRGRRRRREHREIEGWPSARSAETRSDTIRTAIPGNKLLKDAR